MVIDNLSAMDRALLFDANQVQGIIHRMAIQILGIVANDTKFALIGLLRRGAPIADLLLQEIRRSGNTQDILRLDLDVKRYADDLSILYPKTLLKIDDKTPMSDLSGYTVILVDDVLFTGNSLLTVIDHLIHKAPSSILTACLVDRCATRLPIIANIIGVTLQVNANSIIECNIPPYEPTLKIVLASPRTGPITF
jgi:pyrimidine operon attenuation protein/uracil phosphoribosyltransferase